MQVMGFTVVCHPNGLARAKDRRRRENALARSALLYRNSQGNTTRTIHEATMEQK